MSLMFLRFLPLINSISISAVFSLFVYHLHRDWSFFTETIYFSSPFSSTNDSVYILWLEIRFFCLFSVSFGTVSAVICTILQAKQSMRFLT